MTAGPAASTGAAEAELNALPHYLADVAGQRIHFLHVRAVGGGRDRLPLILTHGWPSSFVEMLPLVPLLTDPAPFGGDIGGGVTSWLGALYPEHVAGIHLILPGVDDPPRTDAERAWLKAVDAFDEKDRGYSEIMWTRPDTIAAALQDSPAGLAAWIVDKYRDWSDCDGDLDRRFTRDGILTVLTLYWATGTIGSSFRQYYDWSSTPVRPVVTVPTGVTMTAEPVFRDLPRSFAERSYSDLRQWREPNVGGHFMAMEEPELLATDLRTLFRDLRT